MARLFSLALVVALLPSGLAGPACAKKYKAASDCIAMCNQKWGFMGMMMGTDPWGSVMHKEGASDDAWNTYIAKACGQEASANADSTTSSSTVTATGLVKALGTQPGAVITPSSTAVTSTAAIASLTHSTSSARFTTSTTTSRASSTTHTSSKATTTSTSTKAQLTPQVAQKQTTTSTHTTAQAVNTPTSNSGSPKSENSNSGNSNGNNGSSNSKSGGSDSNSGDSNSNSGGSKSNSGGSTSNGGSSNSGGNGSNASGADVQAYLDAHNSVRSKHGAVPVTWSNAAAEKAQEWANKCTNTHSGGTLGPLGENLAAGTGSFSIAQAVAAWANEVSEYNPSNPQPSHFTQMVWKATTQIGCAVQTCDGIFSGFGAAQYYVCEYSVQGNVIGNFAANVQA